MKKNVLFFVFFFVLFLSSCELGFYQAQIFDESVEDRARSIIDLPAIENPVTEDEYTFLLFTDIHVGSDGFYKNEDDFLKWFQKQMQNENQSSKPIFAVSLGDNMNTGTEWKEYNEFLDKLSDIAANNGIENFRTYSCIGNHDLYHYGWEKFKEHIFPYASYYRFSDGVFSYYVLDSANGTLGEKQRKSLETAMKNDASPKIVLTHVPIYAGGCPSVAFSMQNTMERNILLTLFQKNNVKQAYEGHAHINFGCDYGSWKEEVTASFKNKEGTCRLVTINKVNKTIKSELVVFVK